MNTLVTKLLCKLGPAITICILLWPQQLLSAVRGKLIDANIETFNWSKTRYIYAFGDSYSFVQGTLGYPNFSFIGDYKNLAFTPKQILTNEIIPRNTSSEGSNWLEYLTGCFSGSPIHCRKQLWNFAFAGADIDGALLPLHHDYTVPLVDQVNQWATYAAHVLPHPTHETLTTWWIGINDTGDTVTNATISDFPAFWESEMMSYFEAVEKAYASGLKNHLFINVPPGERAPATVHNPNKAVLQKAHIQLYNEALDKHIAAFSAKYRDTTVLSFDAHTWFNFILDNAAEYGFTNTTGFCACSSSTGYFWYNSGHPTQRVHQLLAKAINAHLNAWT